MRCWLAIKSTCLISILLEQKQIGRDLFHDGVVIVARHHTVILTTIMRRVKDRQSVSQTPFLMRLSATLVSRKERQRKSVGIFQFPWQMSCSCHFHFSPLILNPESQ